MPSPVTPLRRALALAVGLLAAAGAAADLAVAVRSAQGEPVADAVVALVPLDRPAPPPAGAAGEIVQQHEEFTTYVTVVQAGTRVVFPNRDTVQHHVYSLSKAKRFELPLYNPGQAESFVFDVSGTVTLGCNIHDWMLAYLVVVPTPHFAKTDAQGAAQVAAPAGRYRLELWHPRLGAAVTQEVALTGAAPLTREFSLTLKPDRRIRRGGAGKSGGY
ncbi:MAG: methylamine utilization protein [Opitutaceae bacterium]|nr:methylamine utilization protein [Opitutaceae bacterium]